MALNRPYTFELAAMVLDEPGQHDEIKALAERNDVDGEHVERAIAILRNISAAGESVPDFVRREHFLDGWLHGYLSLDDSPTDPSLTVWKLGQLAEAFYRS
ncbi:hypothetical protein E2F47_26155 [Mycobacterium eburneum]|nr:hypothetical protein [Mycobacterium eburneum]TDH47874.1 hypothetical protein E2F47_26155 [Mycobacterium eburneum]